jgi:hypothetical protein
MVNWNVVPISDVDGVECAIMVLTLIVSLITGEAHVREVVMIISWFFSGLVTNISCPISSVYHISSPIYTNLEYATFKNPPSSFCNPDMPLCKCQSINPQNHIHTPPNPQ